MRIIISNSAGIPIYEQIKEQIKTAIFTNELTEGDALPSIRQLAKDLKISVITTTRAYSDLEKEGFVTNMQGKGCFVLAQNGSLMKENAMRQIEEALDTALTAAKIAGITKAEFLEILEVLIKEENYE